jgi:hypothetical protein
MPSRAMSVWTSAATPASSKRRATLDHGGLTGVEPALHRDPAVLRVESDRDAAGKLARRVAHERGVAQRSGAEHDAVYAHRERRFDRGEIAQASAQLDGDRAGRADDRADRDTVLRSARARAVEIDHVQPRHRVRGEAARSGRGVGLVHGRRVVVALREAHALAAEQVDRGISSKRAEVIAARPAGLPLVWRRYRAPSARALRR